MRAALSPHDLTHVQFVLLASLWWLEDQADEAPTQSALAEQAGTDPMMTSQVMRKLEGRGLVARNQHPTDSRARLLALTQSGRALVTRALADVEAADESFFGVVKRGDREALVAALAALASVKKAMPGLPAA